jgi:uncharacterized protein (TIGR02996 family)
MMPSDTDDASHLLEAVAAAPQDHERRWVLADFLAEQGDPRGEFLQLQLNIARRQFTTTMRQRADELWAQHGAAWFRELEPLLSNFRVEAGFPVEGWLAPHLTPEQLKAAFSLPAFVTLTRLHGPIELVAEALAAPAMAALSSVSVQSARELALVAQRAVPGRLERLELEMPLDRQAAHQVVAAQAFRALETLVVSAPRDFRSATDEESALFELAQHPALANVELAVTDTFIPFLPELWSASRWRRLVVAVPPGFNAPTERRCVFEHLDERTTHVQLEGMSRQALRRMRAVMPKETSRVAMSTLMGDDSPISREALLREYRGLDPVLV